jgi:hypothetical protein
VLHLLDDSLEAFLRAEVPLSARQIDVSFEAPDDEWGARVTKPTVNLFLWDVRKNMEERESGMDVVEGDGGKKFRAPPKPRVDCRYLVTAWTTDVKDEHQLLGSLLTAFLTNHELAPDYLQGSYAGVRPIPTMKAALPNGEDNTDFWTALGGQIKPGLDLLVTATVDLVPSVEAGPPVERYEVGVSIDGADADAGDRVEIVGGEAADAEPGATVRSPRGRSTVEPGGRFRVRAGAGDEIVVESSSPLTGTVEEAGIVAPRKRGR